MQSYQTEACTKNGGDLLSEVQAIENSSCVINYYYCKQSAMRKAYVMLLLFCILPILVNSQRPYNKPNGQSNRQRQNRANRNIDYQENIQIADESLLSLEQQKALEESANRNKTKRSISESQRQESDSPHLTKQQLREFRQAKNRKPLVQLIFLLTGALVLVLLIVLFKLFKRQQVHQINAAVQQSPVIHIINPTFGMEQTLHVSISKPCTRSIEVIKQKYLINNTSVNDLNACEYRSQQQTPNTPTFNYYTFSNDI